LLRKIVGWLLVATVLAGGAAHADTTSVEDPDDVTHVWDIKKLGHAHLANPGVLAQTIEFFEEGPAPDAGIELKFFFRKDANNPSRSVEVKRGGTFEQNDRPLEGHIFNRRHRFIGFARVVEGPSYLRVDVPPAMFPERPMDVWIRAVARDRDEVDRTPLLKAIVHG
jgi:hypothetical protein